MPPLCGMIRLTSSIFTVGVILTARQQLAPSKDMSITGLLLAMGILDTGGFVLNNRGMQLEQVSVVSVLASLYGAITVLLAAAFCASASRAGNGRCRGNFYRHSRHQPPTCPPNRRPPKSVLIHYSHDEPVLLQCGASRPFTHDVHVRFATSAPRIVEPGMRVLVPFRNKSHGWRCDGAC